MRRTEADQVARALRDLAERLAGENSVTYSTDMLESFAIDLCDGSRLRVTVDRPGEVR